jgi:hypothetical protein
MYYPSAWQQLNATIQAPFVLAEIRALRESAFKGSPEIQRALAIAEKVEQAYDLQRADLFIPALETFCAIIEPFALTILTGTLRRIGYEFFPQYVSILGIPRESVKAKLNLKKSTDLIRLIGDMYSQYVAGPDAGTLTAELSGNTVTITDTTFLPCQLQLGVFLGAGNFTGMFQDNALVKKHCRAKGDRACTYEFKA